MAERVVQFKAKYAIDLATARDKQIQPQNGGFIKVIKASSSSATIKIAIDEGFNDEDFIELKLGDSLEVPEGFDRFYIKNDAQAGETCTLLVTGGKQKFNVELSPRGQVDSIAAAVAIKGGNTLAHSQATIVSAAAAVVGIAAAAATCEWVIKNDSGSAGTLYIGIAGVDATTGFPLLPGEAVSLMVSAAVYLYAAGGNADARILKGSKV